MPSLHSLSAAPPAGAPRRERHRSSVMDLDNLVTPGETLSTEIPYEAPRVEYTRPLFHAGHPSTHPEHTYEPYHPHHYPHSPRHNYYQFPHHQPQYYDQSHYHTQQTSYPYGHRETYTNHPHSFAPVPDRHATDSRYPPNESHSSYGYDSHQQELANAEQAYPYTPLKAKRKRASPAQLNALNAVFEKTFFPSTELRLRLAQQLAMTPRAVQIWFQNKRQTWRLKNKGGAKGSGTGQSLDDRDDRRRGSRTEESVEEDSGSDFQDQTGNRFAHRSQSGSEVSPSGVAVFTPSSPEQRMDYFSSSSSSSSEPNYSIPASPSAESVRHFRLTSRDDTARAAHSRTASVDPDNSSIWRTEGRPDRDCPSPDPASFPSESLPRGHGTRESSARDVVASSTRSPSNAEAPP
ncbi:hypothetical protein SpCBS45565_g00471 [Spizellomyces sp. 'palustris']|nr:hypothetical protein SpCBS45565_g00471 [Spizellomyces sp. 'palustris']